MLSLHHARWSTILNLSIRDAAVTCRPGSPSTGQAWVARVLVIEDDAAQRDVFTQLLYYNGFEVEHASDADNGIKLALTTRPDVIVMDLILPGPISGLAATSMFKSSPTIGKTPIICMSAYDIDPGQVERAGGDAFLQKPFAGEVLIRAVRKFTGWERSKGNPARN